MNERKEKKKETKFNCKQQDSYGKKEDKKERNKFKNVNGKKKKENLALTYRNKLLNEMQ